MTRNATRNALANGHVATPVTLRLDVRTFVLRPVLRVWPNTATDDDTVTVSGVDARHLCCAPNPEQRAFEPFTTSVEIATSEVRDMAALIWAEAPVLAGLGWATVALEPSVDEIGDRLAGLRGNYKREETADLIDAVPVFEATDVADVTRVTIPWPRAVSVASAVWFIASAADRVAFGVRSRSRRDAGRDEDNASMAHRAWHMLHGGSGTAEGRANDASTGRGYATLNDQIWGGWTATGNRYQGNAFRRWTLGSIASGGCTRGSRRVATAALKAAKAYHQACAQHVRSDVKASAASMLRWHGQTAGPLGATR